MIPMKEMKSLRVWTGAESVIANKVGKPFVFIAEDDGKVTGLTSSKLSVEYYKPKLGNDILLVDTLDDSKLIRLVFDILSSKGYNVVFDTTIDVKYKVLISNKSDDKSFILVKDDRNLNNTLRGIKSVPTDTRKASYSIKPWSSKVEGNVSIKQEMTTNLKVGDKFEKDQPLVYNSGFFEPNIYDNKSIVFKMGSYVKCAFIESLTTYEDSVVFNKNILDKTGETTYKVLSKLLDVESHITNVIPEGSVVKYGDKLMTILDSSVVLDSSLSDRAREILSEASDSSPKANTNGTIERIDVLYNCELEEMDSSIRALADISNKRFKEEKGTTGQVTSEYSVRGIPLAKGQIELKYFISRTASSKVGDKFVLGHQLKNTVGDILDDIKTESGEQIDVLFSVRSVAARITNSSYLLGTTNLLMEHFTNKAIKAYRSK